MREYFSYLLLVIVVLAINPSVKLSAYSQETIDESIIPPDWPILHQAILRKEFDKALRIMEVLPNQVKKRPVRNINLTV